jgi:uncharacterized protein
MSREVAFAAVNLAIEDKKTSGLLFYGGEPLLEKQLIYDIVDYTKKITKDTKHIFYYKMTTNGTLLDEDFLKFSRDINMTIGFSHDGPAQDECRLTSSGGATFNLLEGKIPLLLKYLPYSAGMCVMDPSTVHNASSTVKFLFDKGFRYISLNVNYSKTAKWTKKHLSILEDEYKKLAKMYLNWTKKEEKFYLSPFEMKILSHLKGIKYNEDRRVMSREQPSVAPDGKLYSGSRYIGNPAFEIGDVYSGFDSEKRASIYKIGGIPLASCGDCAIKTRCNYIYDSLASTESGIVPEISPVQCANEQMLTPIADKIAGQLYRERNALFIHKHYNRMYSVVSLVEDRSLIG